MIEQFNIQAEQSVIGALMIDNDAIDRMGDLRAEHFYRADHRKIFAEILRQISAGNGGCDVVSVFSAISHEVDDCLPYLHSIANNTPTAANIGKYSKIVRDRALKRALVALGNEFSDIAASSPEDAEVLIDRASSRLEKLAEARVRQEPVRASDEMLAYIEELDRRASGLGGRVTSTGFPDIDRRLNGGMRPGDLIVLAARPKMGKTALALAIARNVSMVDPALVLSQEMPKAQLHDRNVSALGNIPLEHVLEPSNMTETDWAGLTNALQKLKNMNLILDDQGGLTLMDVRMKAKQVKRKYGLTLMVVDYLQLMDGEGNNRNEQIERITRGLKALGKELGFATLLLSQLNRELEKRPNKRPQPSDLRDSGAIEQDADAVLFLYRDEVYNPDTMDRGICEVDVALCRQGKPGRVALSFIGEQTRFESLSYDWKQPAEQQPKRRGAAMHL